MGILQGKETIDRTKIAAGTALHLIERSEKVGLGLFSLAVLVEGMSESGRELDETMLKGLSQIIEALHWQLFNEPRDYASELQSLRIFAGCESPQ